MSKHQKKEKKSSGYCILQDLPLKRRKEEVSMGILARLGGLSPFLSSALPCCTHGPVQLFIFSHWDCSIQGLSHLLGSIGVRQHLFEERNVAFHWQSSKNAAENNYQHFFNENLQLQRALTRFCAMMGKSTRHLWHSVWMTPKEELVSLWSFLYLKLPHKVLT